MSSDKDFIFGKIAEDNKQRSFEVSTLSLALQQLGAPRAWITLRKAELADRYDFNWFNGNGFLDVYVRTERSLSFNFEQLYSAPTKHPITEIVKRTEELMPEGAGAHASIFRVYDVGRLVATNLTMEDSTYLHVSTKRLCFNILPMKSFFEGKFGKVLEGIV